MQTCESVNVVAGEAAVKECTKEVQEHEGYGHEQTQVRTWVAAKMVRLDVAAIRDTKSLDAICTIVPTLSAFATLLGINE